MGYDVRSDRLAALVYDSALISRLHDMIGTAARAFIHRRDFGIWSDRVTTVVVYYALCRLLHPSGRTVGEEISPDVFFSPHTYRARVRLLLASISLPLIMNTLNSRHASQGAVMSSITDGFLKVIADLYFFFNPRCMGTSLPESLLTAGYMIPNETTKARVRIPGYVFTIAGTVTLMKLVTDVYRVVKHSSVRTVLPISGDKRVADDTESKAPAGTCPVCMGEMDQPTATVCGHVFCWDCCFGWASVDGSPCPLCRTVSLPQDLLPLTAYAPTNAVWDPFWTKPFILDR
jgi:hypothetical protein